MLEQSIALPVSGLGSRLCLNQTVALSQQKLIFPSEQHHSNEVVSTTVDVAAMEVYEVGDRTIKPFQRN